MPTRLSKISPCQLCELISCHPLIPCVPATLQFLSTLARWLGALAFAVPSGCNAFPIIASTGFAPVLCSTWPPSMHLMLFCFSSCHSLPPDVICLLIICKLLLSRTFMRIESLLIYSLLLPQCLVHDTCSINICEWINRSIIRWLLVGLTMLIK